MSEISKKDLMKAILEVHEIAKTIQSDVYQIKKDIEEIKKDVEYIKRDIEEIKIIVKK